MDLKIDVLDSGFVRLVSYMQPAAEAGPDWSGDLEVVRNARVSYDADWRDAAHGRDGKLLEYLYKNRHTSPFEAMVFTFEVKAPLFVVRQWQRHRTWSYNEISGRYCALDEGYYVPAIEQVTTQSDSNKQMRTNVLHPEAEAIAQAIDLHNRASDTLYRELLANGCPRELARGVLPVTTYTRMFATVDLHNLLHFIALRTHEHAQYEIREYAHALVRLIQPVVPKIMHAVLGDQHVA